MTPTDKPPCLPGCDHLLWRRPTLPVSTTSIAHTFHAPGCPNAPKEPAARCECGADDYNARLQKGAEYVPVTPLPHALNCPKRPAPTPEPPKPEAESAEPPILVRIRAATQRILDGHTPMRIDYLYGELGNQNSSLRDDLAAERSAREKAEAEREELALLTVPSDDDAQVAVRLRIAEARVAELEDAILSTDAILDSENLKTPIDALVPAILAARSAKGGANG